MKKHYKFIYIPSLLICLICVFVVAAKHIHRVISQRLILNSSTHSSSPMPSFIPGEGGFKPTIPPGVPYGAQLLTLGENRFLLLADIVSGKSASVSNYSYPVCERKVWFVSKEGEKELPIGPIGYSLHQPFEIRYSPPYLSYVVRKGHKNSQKVLTSQFFLYDLSTDKEKYLGEFKGTYSARILPYHVAFPSLPQSYIIEHLISLASSDSSRILDKKA